MISHGDELGRTQQGNNNVYCQDNELSWIDWDDAREHEVLTEFTARVIALRAAHPVFRRKRFFQGRPIHGSSIDDIAWLRPDGQHMTDEDWNAGHPRAIAIFLNGRGIPDRDELGEHDHRRLVPAADQRPPPAGHASPCPTSPTDGPGSSSSTPPTRCWPDSRRRRPAPGSRQRVPARSMQVLQCRS